MGGTIETVAVVLTLVALGATLWLLFSREREARRRYRILSETAAVSDAGGSLEETIEALCDILVPEFADFCMIDLIDQDGDVRRAGLRVSPGGSPGAEAGLAARRPSIPQRMIDGDRGPSLTPRFYERMTDRDLQGLATGPEDLEFLRSLRSRSAITVALNARGRVTGTLTLAVAWSGRRYRGEDAHFAWVLSGRVALALDNCGLFADLEKAERARAEIADTLQRGLLPPPLPNIPGWSVAAMYRPAGSENEVGGDFYDVFRVSDGWMLVIGDVTGQGAGAASLTAVARHTLRTAASLTGDPVVALETLNRVLFAGGDSSLCTIVALALQEDPTEPIRIAIAGHPPPLLIDGDEVSEISEADPVLGAFADSHWTLSHCPLEPGQQLVVVTDGVLEAQGADERFGPERLRSELKGASDPAQILQRVESSLQAFTNGAVEDDIAILALAAAADASSDRVVSLPGLEVANG
ncbi:MAG TPA: SpoIIE family protein phosphatase [Solirubrobacterales bacterium]